MSGIFLDIGAHIGESIETACDKKYNFEKLYAFEPSAFGIKWLLKFKNNRVIIVPVGLGNNNRETTLFGAGSVGGSIYSDKKRHWSNSETIKIIKFSDWFNSNIPKDCKVWIKINVEGSELEIIQEMKLIDSPSCIASVLVSFDVEKIPSLKGKSSELKGILETLQIPWSERTRIFSVKEWLNSFPELRNKLSIHEQIMNYFRMDIPIARNFRRAFRPFFPKKLWLWAALKLGPNRKRNF